MKADKKRFFNFIRKANYMKYVRINIAVLIILNLLLVQLSYASTLQDLFEGENITFDIIEFNNWQLINVEGIENSSTGIDDISVSTSTYFSSLYGSRAGIYYGNQNSLRLSDGHVNLNWSYEVHGLHGSSIDLPHSF